MASAKPRLSLIRIIEMNLGFLGLQFSFGLQQGNMVPIYSWLGADEASLPILQLAGPMTGLIIQPLIGAMSDRTNSRFGRRTPYFLIGAIMCSLGLFLMPHSATLLMAASLLWFLDAGNNITMEPYRAYVSDRLDESQHEIGFLTQSAFTGLAQSLAFLMPSILVYRFGFDPNAVDDHNIPDITHVAFLIGAILSISTILWSVIRVPELPLSGAEKARIDAQPKSVSATLGEIWSAILEMPQAMRQMAWMSLFQWYGLSIYWSYAVLSIGRSVFDTTDKTSDAFREATLTGAATGRVLQLHWLFRGLCDDPAGPALRRAPAPYGMPNARRIELAPSAVSHRPFRRNKRVPRGARDAAAWDASPVDHCRAWYGSWLGEHHGQPLCHPRRLRPAGTDRRLHGHLQHDDVIPMLINGLTFPLLFGPLLGGDSRNAITFAVCFCSARRSRCSG